MLRKLWLVLGLLTFGTLQAEYRPPILDFGVGVGYRHDNYKMNMQGFIPNPTTNFTKSTKEIWKWKWHNIQIVESSAVLRYTTCLNYYFRFNADWGRIHAGEGHLDGYALLPNTSSSSSSSPSVSSSDYENFSRIKNKPNRGNVQDYSGCVGYQFRSNGRRCIMTPLVGFSYHHQKLEFHHAKQVIDLFDPFPVLGHIPDLHVLYKPRWFGPFIGIDVEVQVDIPCVLFFVNAEWHWAQFRSTNKWNFANTFVNKFNQNSRSKGVILNGGVSYKIQNCMWFTVFGTFRNFHADRGNHKTIKYKNHLKFPAQTFGTFPAFPDFTEPGHRGKHNDNDLLSFKWNSYVVGISFDYRY